MADYAAASAAANLCVKKLFGTIVEYTEKINGGQKKRINIGIGIGIYCKGEIFWKHWLVY